MSYPNEHLSAALEWIERNVGSARDHGTFIYGDGIRLVARALSETGPRSLSPGLAPPAKTDHEAAPVAVEEMIRAQAFEEAARIVEGIAPDFVDCDVLAAAIRGLASPGLASETRGAGSAPERGDGARALRARLDAMTDEQRAGVARRLEALQREVQERDEKGLCDNCDGPGAEPDSDPASTSRLCAKCRRSLSSSTTGAGRRATREVSDE